MAYEDGARAATLDEAGFPAKRTTVRSSTNGTSRMYTGSKRTDDARGVAGRVSPPPGASGFFLPDGTACAVGEDGVAVVSMATRAAPTRPEEEDDATRRVRLDRRVADARGRRARAWGSTRTRRPAGPRPRRGGASRGNSRRRRGGGDARERRHQNRARGPRGERRRRRLPRRRGRKRAGTPPPSGRTSWRTSDDSRSDDDEGSRPDRLATDARPALVEALASLTADEAEAMRRAISASKAAARGGGADATPVRGGARPRAAGNNAARTMRRRVRILVLDPPRTRGRGFLRRERRNDAHSHEERRLDGVRRRCATATPSRRPGATARPRRAEAARSRGDVPGRDARGPASVPVVFVGKKAGVEGRRAGAGAAAARGRKGGRLRRERGEKDGARAKKTEWIERRDSNLARPSGTLCGARARGAFGRFARRPRRVAPGRSFRARTILTSGRSTR